MDQIIKIIGKLGLVPVVKINNSESAVPLAIALKNAGLPYAEITFRSSAAKDAIRMIKTQVPDFFVGAGTVINCDQMKLALSAGADFLVSPGLDEKILAFCSKKGVAYFPGVLSPSEIQKALNYQFEVLKFFPAEAGGGVQTIDALYGPFPNVKFIPSGGINEKNIVDYISRPNIIACGGSWFVESNLIDEGNFAEITNKTINILRTLKDVLERRAL